MNAFQKLVLLLASMAAGDTTEAAQNRADRIRENRRVRPEQSEGRHRHAHHADRSTGAQRRMLRRV